jgi:hypothetical protein
MSICVGISTLLILRDLLELIKNIMYSISDLLLNQIKKPEWTKEIGFLNEIRLEFVEFINPIIKKNNYKMVLLIDDLDKCSIEKIYLVIKALSLLKYSDCNVYMFLTFNSLKITEALQTYYKTKYMINEIDSNIMLNKLTNLIFCLPEKNNFENLFLLEEYLNLEKNYIDLEDHLIEDENNIDEIKSIKLENNEINEIPENILINYNVSDMEIMKIKKILLNNKLGLYQLEYYYKYLKKIETIYNNKSINELKLLIKNKLANLKLELEMNYYKGLDNDEIKLLQIITEKTKYSEGSISKNLIKIINIYKISKYLLPNILINKKSILMHLIIIVENWLNIFIEILKKISKIKLNFTYAKIIECFENKTLLFFYLNSKEEFTYNDELVLYLTNFDIKIINIIELEPYIFNLDRCYYK